jgi:hypothetical protein
MSSHKLYEIRALQDRSGSIAAKTMLSMLSPTYDNLLVCRPTNENHRALILSKIQKFKFITKNLVKDFESYKKSLTPPEQVSVRDFKISIILGWVGGVVT